MDKANQWIEDPVYKQALNNKNQPKNLSNYLQNIEYMKKLEQHEKFRSYQDNQLDEISRKLSENTDKMARA